MASIESRWSSSNIRIIFADGLITDRLLSDLKIKDTCILHGDYHHLYNKVWPNSDNFGQHIYVKIKSHLKKMLLCENKSQWDIAYLQASEILKDYPSKLDLLTSIYNNSSYYSGYVIKEVEGNLGLHGSCMAEANHSSVVSHLGPGGLISISNHLTKLLERQQHFYNKEREIEIRNEVSRHKYKSPFYGEFGVQDTMAKTKLSNPVKTS